MSYRIAHALCVGSAVGTVTIPYRPRCRPCMYQIVQSATNIPAPPPSQTVYIRGEPEGPVTETFPRPERGDKHDNNSDQLITRIPHFCGQKQPTKAHTHCDHTGTLD